MKLQTCRRHPKAGPFLAECSGCKQELYDIQVRNRAEADARRDARTALATIGTDPTARILSVTRIGSALVVATHQPDAHLPYAVDTFRLPTPAETDPEQVDPLTPGQWMLIDQHGDHTPHEVDHMVTEAHAYLAEVGITNDEPAAAQAA